MSIVGKARRFWRGVVAAFWDAVDWEEQPVETMTASTTLYRGQHRREHATLFGLPVVVNPALNEGDVYLVNRPSLDVLRDMIADLPPPEPPRIVFAPFPPFDIPDMNGTVFTSDTVTKGLGGIRAEMGDCYVYGNKRIIMGADFADTKGNAGVEFTAYDLTRPLTTQDRLEMAMYHPAFGGVE